jgi:hypothetical protein
MEVAESRHSFTTTTHTSNVDLPSSVQQATARLSARKVAVAGGKQGPKPPSQGRYKLREDLPFLPHGIASYVPYFQSISCNRLK